MRVVVGEDHALLRDLLVRQLEGLGHEVVATAGDAATLSAALRDPRAEVGVVDVRMPPGFTDEGLRVAIEVRRERPGFPVLVLSQYVERVYARELLASGEGSVGYLLKDRVADTAAFVDALGQVAGGGTVLDPEVVAVLMNRAEGPLDRLTPREREVLALMAQGRSNTAVAADLLIGDKAVAKHINAIFTKLDLPVGPGQHRRVRAVLTYLDA